MMFRNNAIPNIIIYIEIKAHYIYEGITTVYQYNFTTNLKLLTNGDQ